MLKAAAERGVQVHVIVYKEVAQALTRKSYSAIPREVMHGLWLMLASELRGMPTMGDL